MVAVDAALPLPTLLSQALVAFTIEFDNEFEHRMPHRTTRHGSTGASRGGLTGASTVGSTGGSRGGSTGASTVGSTGGSRGGPWLVSMAMWSNCMRFVGESGTSVRELESLARTKTNLNGMERWGYIVVDAVDADRIRATPKGRQAREVWGPLSGEIEQRWRARFGAGEIDRLRAALGALVSRLDVELPDCLPILGYGLFSGGPVGKPMAPAACERNADTRLPLAALLSRPLLAFAIEFERESDLSLAISANVVRVLDEKGVRVRDLPLLTGVSKEAIQMALGVLQKKGAVVIGQDRTARLTAKGREMQDGYRRLLGMIEERWRARFGEETIRAVRESLEPLAGEPTAGRSPLFRGLDPYPDGWRASVRKPQTLPHYPMVLHRGGFPDGS